MSANYVLLETIELTTSAASVTFDNIPQTGYTDLVLKCSARTTYASAYGDSFYVSFNGSSSNMSRRRMYGLGAGTPGSDSASNSYGGFGSAASQTSNVFGISELYIPNYTSDKLKTSSLYAVSENNAAEAQIILNANLWSSTAAINSITLTSETSSNFVQYSSFSLYGVADLNTTPTTVPKASGGNIVTSDGTYWYHTFLSSGYFIPQANITCDYLVVAGGGAGGEGYSTRTGGGGAGGLRSTVGATGGGGTLETPVLLSSGTSYAITVGAGSVGGNGSNSSIAGTGLTTITSLGGGGGTQSPATANSGGSGGGAGWNPTNGIGIGGAGTAGQGFAGGNSSTGASYAAGGGGGAGAVGQAAPNNSTGGAGGAGVSISALATATGTGVSNYYAGGGGGGGSTAGAGGAGGGGNGSSGSIGTAGRANTGGGGGGQLGEGYSAKGGSGIIIIRYAMV